MLPRATSIKKSHAFTTHDRVKQITQDAHRSRGARRILRTQPQSQSKRPSGNTSSLRDGGTSNHESRQRRSNRQVPARESNASTRKRRHRHRRCGRVCRKASNAPKCSGQSTNAHRKQSAHRGITTQRVTILFDRRVAAQRAVPIGRRRVLTSRGTLTKSTNRELQTLAL